MADKENDSGGWKWAYVIPMMALLIPIFAVTNLNLTEILTSITAAVVAAIGAGTVAARYLIGYRHQLRMSELDTQRDIVALEARQLTEAQRVLDLDDRIDQLRPEPKPSPPAEA